MCTVVRPSCNMFQTFSHWQKPSKFLTQAELWLYVHPFVVSSKQESIVCSDSLGTIWKHEKFGYFSIIQNIFRTQLQARSETFIDFLKKILFDRRYQYAQGERLVRFVFLVFKFLTRFVCLWDDLLKWHRWVNKTILILLLRVKCISTVTGLTNCPFFSTAPPAGLAKKPTFCNESRLRRGILHKSGHVTYNKFQF